MLMDKIATRSMNFAEGHNLSEWGVQRNTEVKLVSPRQNLHTVQSVSVSRIHCQWWKRFLWVSVWVHGAIRTPLHIHGLEGHLTMTIM
jgi:hypothetical protein